MQEKNWHKFPVLFFLYIAQSIPMSFFSTVVPVIMRQENYSLTSIGLLQLIKLPWILKFLWAPLVDNKAQSTRALRRMVFLSEGFYALVICAIAFFDLQTDFKLIIFLVIIAFIASATQDIAVDRYAILSLKPGERSVGNSMQSGGSFIGSFFGTGVLLVAYYYFGWSVILFMLAGFIMLALLPFALSRREVFVNEEKKQTVGLKDILSFFGEKGKVFHILMLLFYYAGIIGIMTMLKPYLVDLGYNVKDIAFMSGIFGTLTAATATFAGGFIVKKIGRKVSLYMFLALSVITGLYWGFMSSEALPSLVALYGGIGLVWASYGLSTVAIYTLAMDKVRKGREGTDFTIQIVLTHIGSLLVATLSGKIAHETGYTALFFGEAAVASMVFLLVYGATRKTGSTIKN
ncbi:MAG: muropeptide transporter [Bacteroidetes bacterium]|nr:muropeptide transporter [Bacteroidota bacterium]